MLELLGARFVKDPTPRMTVLVSLLKGVEGSVDAVKRKIPIVFIARFYSRLEERFLESGLVLESAKGLSKCI